MSQLYAVIRGRMWHTLRDLAKHIPHRALRQSASTWVTNAWMRDVSAHIFGVQTAEDHASAQFLRQLPIGKRQPGI